MPKLEITTMIGCPLKCTFCPQDELRGAYGRNGAKYLSLEDFHTVLAKIPRHVLIEFSGMAEPWANPQATDMLEHALLQGYRVSIYTTLYGLTIEDAHRVVGLLRDHDAQFDHMCLHLPDRNMNMRGWRHSDEYDQVLAIVMAIPRFSAWYEKRFSAMTMDGSGAVHPSLAHHRIGVREKNWRGHSRAGNLRPELIKELGAQPVHAHRGAVVCGYTPFFDQNVLLPNGDVMLCCMDYSLRHRLGNLLEESYEDLFRSRELTEIRAANATPGASDRSLCKACSAAAVYRLEGSEWVDQAPVPLRRAIRNLVPAIQDAMSRKLQRNRAADSAEP
jgi:radical SAM protein with 4Fe4S-binding SPASM domain